MTAGERITAIDLIVRDLDASSDFIEAITEPSSSERVEGFSCYSFESFDVMLSESALIDIGVVGGVILHVKVADVESRVASIQNGSGLTPEFGPQKTDWGTYSAIYSDPNAGFAIDLYAEDS